MSWIVRCVATTGAVNSAGRAVVEKFGAAFGSEAAESTELFKMVVTPDKGNCELVKK